MTLMEEIAGPFLYVFSYQQKQFARLQGAAVSSEKNGQSADRLGQLAAAHAALTSSDSPIRLPRSHRGLFSFFWRFLVHLSRLVDVRMYSKCLHDITWWWNARLKPQGDDGKTLRMALFSYVSSSLTRKHLSHALK